MNPQRKMVTVLTVYTKDGELMGYRQASASLAGHRLTTRNFHFVWSEVFSVEVPPCR